MALSGNARRMIEKLKTADEELDRRIAQITAARAEAFDGSGTAANNGMAHCRKNPPEHERKVRQRLRGAPESRGGGLKNFNPKIDDRNN